MSEWILKDAPVDMLIRLGFATAEEACKNGFKTRRLFRKGTRRAYVMVFNHRTAKQGRLLGKIPYCYVERPSPQKPVDVEYFAFFDHQQHHLDKIPDLC